MHGWFQCLSYFLHSAFKYFHTDCNIKYSFSLRTNISLRQSRPVLRTTPTCNISGSRQPATFSPGIIDLSVRRRMNEGNCKSVADVPITSQSKGWRGISYQQKPELGINLIIYGPVTNPLCTVYCVLCTVYCVLCTLRWWELPATEYYEMR